MPEIQHDNQLLISVVTGVFSLVASVIGSLVLHKKYSQDNKLSLETSVQESMIKFQDRIENEIKETKKENEVLRSKVKELEFKVSELLRINEGVLVEKLGWMQKAFILQAKLSIYETNPTVTKEEVDAFVEQVASLEEEIDNHEQ